MSNLSFRTAHDADIPAIVDLVVHAYRGETSRQGWTSEADLLDGDRIDAEGVARELHAADSEILLAERDGELMACAHVTRRAPGLGYFGLFAVRPTGQGNGIGRHVLATAEAFVVETWDVHTLEMTVLGPRPELVAYYGRRGFLPTGEIRQLPAEIRRRPETADLPLRFDVLAKAVSPRVAESSPAA